MCVYMGSGLTLGLAPKHELQKKGNTKKRYTVARSLHAYVAGRPTVYIIYIKAVVLVILLTFAVTFLLQVDFFLVGTSRA